MLLYGSGSSAFVIVFIAVVIWKGIALLLIVKDVELGQTLWKHKEAHGLKQWRSTFNCHGSKPCDSFSVGLCPLTSSELWKQHGFLTKLSIISTLSYDSQWWWWFTIHWKQVFGALQTAWKPGIGLFIQSHFWDILLHFGHNWDEVFACPSSSEEKEKSLRNKPRQEAPDSLPEKERCRFLFRCLFDCAGHPGFLGNGQPLPFGHPGTNSHFWVTSTLSSYYGANSILFKEFVFPISIWISTLGPKQSWRWSYHQKD